MNPLKEIRSLLLLLTVLVVSGPLSCASDQIGDKNEQDRPNIIIMYSDDHTAQAIGAYQKVLEYGLKLDHTPTPNLDRMAEQGMRFDNAFVTNSICKPSRAVLLTGMHNHKNKVWRNVGMSLDTAMTTFPKLLTRSGYQTAMVGKWHLGTEPQGFDFYEILYGQGPYYNPRMRTDRGDTTYHGHTTEIVTDRALHWLKNGRSGDEPFMLMYNQKAPHRNWLPGPRHLNDYRDRDLPEPSSLFYDYSGLASPAKNQQMEIGNHMSWGWDLKVPKNPETGKEGQMDYLIRRNDLTEDQIKTIKDAYAENNQYLYDNWDQMTEKDKIRWKYQRYVKDYLRVIRGVDDGVGRLMDYLKRENLYDNTVVIYAGDQGFFLGENGWFDKRWIYEESMRMPLIVHWPEGIDAGSVSKHLVQNLDLAPTILDLANTDIPDQVQGRSLVPILKGEDPEWRDAVYYHYYEGPPRVHNVAKHYGIRTQRYTIAHYYEQDEWELFDLEEDPEQLQSVYGDSEYSQVEERLKNKIDELQKKYEVEFMPEKYEKD